MTPFEIALGEYGVTEWAGPRHNPEVLKYFRETGFPAVKNDETAWCSAFVAWCCLKAGLPHTGSLMARSWLNWGKPVFEPQIGDIVVFWRNSLSSPWGHAGFYVRNNGSKIWTLGGNQDNKVGIEPYFGINLLGYRRAK